MANIHASLAGITHPLSSGVVISFAVHVGDKCVSSWTGGAERAQGMHQPTLVVRRVEKD
jgi:hypothetical protein